MTIGHNCFPEQTVTARRLFYSLCVPIHLQLTESNIVFTWINSQGVRSDSGFEVECMSRSTDEFRESGKTVTVEVERSFFGGKSYASISPTAFERWDRDVGCLTIPLEKQKEMLANYIAAKEFQGINVVVEPRGTVS